MSEQLFSVWIHWGLKTPITFKLLGAYIFKPHGPLGFSLVNNSKITSFSALLSYYPHCKAYSMDMARPCFKNEETEVKIPWGYEFKLLPYSTFPRAPQFHQVP